MENQKKFEWKRQFVHILLGIAIVSMLLYGFLDKLTLLILSLMGIVLSYMSTRGKIHIISPLLEKFERPDELRNFPGKGILFYFIGAYLSLLFFDKDIAMASIMVLAFGDSISHLYGISYGKLKHPFSSSKFLEGTVAGMLAGCIGALVFIPWQEAIVAALAGMVIESIEIRLWNHQFDDNLLVPLASGFAVLLVRALNNIIL